MRVLQPGALERGMFEMTIDHHLLLYGNPELGDHAIVEGLQKGPISITVKQVNRGNPGYARIVYCLPYGVHARGGLGTAIIQPGVVTPAVGSAREPVGGPARGLILSRKAHQRIEVYPHAAASYHQAALDLVFNGIQVKLTNFRGKYVYIKTMASGLWRIMRGEASDHKVLG